MKMFSITLCAVARMVSWLGPQVYSRGLASGSYDEAAFPSNCRASLPGLPSLHTSCLDVFRLASAGTNQFNAVATKRGQVDQAAVGFATREAGDRACMRLLKRPEVATRTLCSNAHSSRRDNFRDWLSRNSYMAWGGSLAHRQPIP